MGGWPQRQVGDGRLAPKTGGRWEVETHVILITISSHHRDRHSMSSNTVVLGVETTIFVLVRF